MHQNCPKCGSENTYQDGLIWICPECSNEWTENEASKSESLVADDASVRDANGNILTDGDTVVVLKDLKIKGSSSSVKSGTKVRKIRLHDAGDGHNISCKIDGIGAVNLKSEFVRKV